MTASPFSTEFLDPFKANVQFIQSRIDKKEPFQERPFRRELLSHEALFQLAKTLGKRYKVSFKEQKGFNLKKDFDKHTKLLKNAYFELSVAEDEKVPLPTGSEWIVDNYPLLEPHISEVQQFFKNRLYKKLPKIEEGPCKGLPRIYIYTRELLQNTDSSIENDILTQFINSSQYAEPLTMRELRAFPNMIRIVLFITLASLAQFNIVTKKQSDLSTKVVDEILSTNQKNSSESILTLAKKMDQNPELWTTGSIVFLLQKLKDCGNAGALCVQWLNQKMLEVEINPQMIVADVLHLLTENQISISHCFSLFRKISILNWEDWFEEVSILHSILKQDPARIYEKSSFATRENCRGQIEILAKNLNENETEIGKKLIAFAKEQYSQCETETASIYGSVCYYLIDDGLIIFEKNIEARITILQKIQRWSKKNAFPIWLTGFFVTASTITAIPLVYLYTQGSGWIMLGSMGFLVSILASEISFQFLQWLVFHFKTPTPLPKLSRIEAQKNEYLSLVAIQTILTSREKINELVKELEIHCLSNNARNVYFAIVADYVDAKEKVLSEDKGLEDYAKQLIERLNQQNPKFFFFIRDRKWSPTEQLFIGWERKRGKIHQLNQLILRQKPDGWHTIGGDETIIPNIKYVITLDEDTKIPPGNVLKMIGTIAHPLNKAVFNPSTEIVKRGYAIIQPSLDAPFGKSLLSRFSEILSEAPGTDPYSRLISNITQDLFQIGSYVGKGIYEVSAFEKALNGWISDGKILSHDMLEGSLARAGLASDINLLDSFPLNYHTYTKRLHRWTRGDWQLLSWITPKIPNQKLGWVKNPLTMVRRWLLLDNLRRSLVNISAFTVLMAGFSVLPGSPFYWFILVFLSINLPFITSILDAIFIPITKPEHIIPIYYKISHQFKKQFEQSILRTAFIPSLAYVQLNAIVTTLYRIFVSGKHLLEWTPTALIERKQHRSLITEYAEMMIPLLATASIASMLGVFHPHKMLQSIPLLALWLMSPYLAYMVGKPPSLNEKKLSSKDKKRLYHIAFDTWKFFDELITEKNNFLVPDNIQLVPLPVVAIRTSPTNIGFQFLSILTAYDFGFICASDMLHRFKNTFNTIDKLEKFNGHLYNWYNIETLKPLYPRYVSSVDSGNLICDYIALRAALKNLIGDEIFTDKHWNFILSLLEKISLKINPGMTTKMDSLISRLESIKTTVDQSPNHPEKELVRKEIQTFISNNPINGILEVYSCLEDLRKCCFTNDHKDEKKTGILTEITSILRSPIPSWKGSLAYSDRINQLIHEIEPLIEESGQDCFQKLKDFNKEFHIISSFVISTTHGLIEKVTQQIDETDFKFLYSPKEKLLTIGYQVESNVLDSNFYTFLASEACLTSLVAIAKGDIESKHWFALGRQIVKTSGGKALLSWTGSTFEYLMPYILIKPLPKTLMYESYRVSVQAQKKYGKTHHLPWGISESGYGITDVEGNYQYRGFGIPELGLKRGLHDDLVISPYSTFLSLPFDPAAAMENISYLEKEGARGRYGFYESIDYTPRRLTKNEKSYVLESHLGHHQGMILTTINNVLNDHILQKRFESCIMIKAFSTLLEEHFPFDGETLKLLKPKHNSYLRAQREKKVPKERSLITPHTLFPDTHVLSNGKLSEMIDNAGSGYLFYKRSIALTRWREDFISNEKGYYIFIRDLDSKEIWSIGYQPLRTETKNYEVIYSAEKVVIHRTDFDISTTCEITISPENNAEIRKLTFRNESNRKRRLEITSYGEVALTSLFADANHTTFSNMFIESEFNQQYDALIYRRVPRSHNDKEVFLGHMIIYSVCWSRLQWDTNRRSFVGRNQDIHFPQAMKAGIPFSGGSKRTLDPIFSLRPIVEVGSLGSESISFVTAAADTHDDLIGIIKSYFSPSSILRAFELSLARSNVEIRYEQIPIEKIHLFQQFSKAIFFHLDPSTFNLEARNNNRLQQQSLWRFGISGDFPIVLVKLTEQKQLSLVKDLMTCHRYLDKRGLNYDLVILNEVIEGYRAEFQDELINLLTLTSTGEKNDTDQPKGKVYILKNQEMSREEVTLIEALAQECYTEKDNNLIKSPNPVLLNLPKMLRNSTSIEKIDPKEYQNVLFYNGFGGFIDQGKAYRIFTESNRVCPQPWSNVIGSKTFGFLVTETGGGYTWSENCQENRLTPWTPDPVTDPKGEMIYLRDSSSKQFYPLTSPPCIVDNHFGYTNFIKKSGAIKTDMIMSSSMDKKVKFWKIKITNNSNEFKQVELYLYIDWVLGVIPLKNKSQLLTEFDPKFQILHARNNYNGSFSGRTAFIGSSETIYSYTTSKREFIGRNLDTNGPAALRVDTKIAPLKNQISSGNDGVGVIHQVLQIPPGQEKEVLFFLGEENTLQGARESSISYKSLSTWKTEWENVKNFWEEATTRIQVKTDDPSFDLLMNGWLIYQTLSCRILAKTGYYQCSGALGFRDQLQDSMALLTVDPQRTRNQLLLHASRQFVEGDVQHWWSPPAGKGVRTKFSDDYLWMPYCLLRYLEVTGDLSILDEIVPYLEGEHLKENEQEIYFLPHVSSVQASLYDHCILALDRALKFGSHGLPLMGCGDWNDGMNEVGYHGKGESVWLGWFLYDILNRFKSICELKKDTQHAVTYKESAKKLLANIEESGWDGDWYRRAYFDDGTPLGSKVNDACEIDSLSQSWSVISKGGIRERQNRSIDSAIRNLVKHDSKVICLLTPPFTNTKLEPGYIKSYPAGVRENGAQYTHAATWVILASTILGRGNQAFDLFKMINPINHTLDSSGVEKYRGEPYVLAGDVYSQPPFAGQVGWSWYTGASGWLYTVALEGILGFKIRVDHLLIEPCIPSVWKNFTIKYKRENTIYDIRVMNPEGKEHGVKEIKIDGKIIPDKKIPLTSANSNQTIIVEVTMG
jgi:cyclic beta-1,2-glucan synthetase